MSSACPAAQPEFIDMPRAAEILKVGRRTVCRLIEEGEIEGHQLRINRGHWRVSLPSFRWNDSSIPWSQYAQTVPTLTFSI